MNTTKLSFRDLKAEDVEVRVAMCKEKGVSLLIYKDARVDQAILDETVGQLNWKKSYRVVKDNLYCTIEIWDSDKGQWVGKEDCGVESNTEKEKGEASDAQKRAGFAWGIGRELYSVPFIWIDSKQCRIEPKDRGFVCKDKFQVTKLQVENKKVTDLVIANEAGAVVWAMNKTSVKDRVPQQQATSVTEKAADKAPVKVKTAQPVSKPSVQPAQAKKLMSVAEALEYKILNKAGKPTPLKASLAACKTEDSQKKMMEFLHDKVKEKSDASEACLVLFRALQSKEISFAS